MPDPATYRPAPGSIPVEPGVYRFRDPHGRVIYVGKAKSLRSRLNSYFADLSGHQVYACGAPIVVDSAKRDYVAEAQLPEDEFYADAFTTEADKALP